MTSSSNRTMTQSMIAFAGAVLLSATCISIALAPVNAARAATSSAPVTAQVR